MRKPTSQKQGMSHLHPVLSSHWVAREVAWYVHPYVTAPNYEGDYVSSRPQEFCGKMEKRGKYFRFGATGRVLPVSDFQQIGWDPWRCLCLWCMAEVFPVGSRMGMGSGLTMWKEKKETFSGKENILKKKKKKKKRDFSSLVDNFLSSMQNTKRFWNQKWQWIFLCGKVLLLSHLHLWFF